MAKVKRNFMKLLEDRWSQGKFVCVGLDPRVELIPNWPGTVSYADSAEALYDFNEAIVQATRDLVCAYKVNRAFYDRYGSAGQEAMEGTFAAIRELAPDVPTILDAKYGDTPDTNEAYVAHAFDCLKADAVTVNPYMGGASLKPFFDRADKGVFVLCRTSNPGADELQEIRTNICEKLHRFVAFQAKVDWGKHGNCGLVVGATDPEQLRAVRSLVGYIPILIPGVGAQGGDLEAAVRAGRDGQRKGIIVNSSRAIIHASSGDDFAEAARSETIVLDQRIRDILRG